MSHFEKLINDYLKVLDDVCQAHGCAYRLSREINYQRYIFYYDSCHTNSITIEFDGPGMGPVRNTLGDLMHDHCSCVTYPSVAISEPYRRRDGYMGTLYDLIVDTRNFFSHTLRIKETEYTKHIWEELLMKNFTKNDLKNGDFVILRNGKVGIVIVDTGKVVYDGCGFDNLSSWNADLTSRHIAHIPEFNSYDIMKVCRNVNTFDRAKSAVSDRIVYDREKIETVEEMTLDEICKALGKNVKIVKGE